MSIWSAIKGLFGSSDKGMIEQAADVVERFKPGEVKQHEMSIEDLKAGDESQNSARNMQQLSGGDNWFDVLINGINRLPRPVITGWVIGILFGWIDEPSYLVALNPITLNILWTVISFWFGSRVIVKDIPAAIVTYHQIKSKISKAS